MTNEDNEHITIDEALTMSSVQRFKYLLDRWQLQDPPRVTGKVMQRSPGSNMRVLKDVKDTQGKNLEYPIRLSRAQSLTESGIHLGTQYGDLDGAYVTASIRLSSSKELKQRDNPFLLRAFDPVRMSMIPKSAVCHDGKGNILIAESIEKHYIESQVKIIEDEIKDRRNHLHQELDSLGQERDDLASKRNQLNGEIQKQMAELKQATEDSNTHHQLIDEAYSNLRSREDAVTELVAAARRKVEWLRMLDFISSRQYDAFIGALGQQNEQDQSHQCTFDDDLNGDFSALVAYVQAYLFHDRKVLYPRYLLEDILTLLRTNDMVVLAGLSGSGKTQLVKSFAEAIGGEARIIPVKPNWTSTEDLLGYYNPLQRSYLTTPFLNALIDASRDPSKVYLICLDEMNLARLEYYFADFLSQLEERRKTPMISLYAREEEEHVSAEYRLFSALSEKNCENHDQATAENRFDSTISALSQQELAEQLKSILGLSDHEQLISLHSRLRRLVSGALGVPSSLELPSNVRIIGTVNIDETTHYLSPKVLDRVHVVKFENPLHYDSEAISEEVGESIATGSTGCLPVYVHPTQLVPMRQDYPVPDKNDELVIVLMEWNSFFEELGIDIGLRTIRQAILYRDLFVELSPEHRHDAEQVALNNVLLHKVLPRFSFDGATDRDILTNHTASDDERQKMHTVKIFAAIVKDKLNLQHTGMPQYKVPLLTAVAELERLVRKAQNNDGVFNYWA